MSNKLKLPLEITAGNLKVSLISSSEVKIKIGDASVTCGIETLREVLSSLKNIRDEMEDEYDLED
jgi:hypothetical protein